MRKDYGMPMRLPEMDPCYFCEIVSGGSDGWNVIERTDVTMTLLNGRQFEVGQCIVIPVRHRPTLLDLTPMEDAAVMGAARRAAKALVEAFDPDGVLLYQNNGVGSAQEVPHFHLHVVPRRPGSDWGPGPPHLARIERGQAHLDYRAVTEAKRQTVEAIRRALAVS
jgi:diadenosine tetraphosphate (Ap4A) HIT family hydrolase